MPIDPITGAIILGGISAGSAVAGGIGAKKRAKQQHQYNKELAKYNYDQNYAMYLENRAYNTPEEQMNRYRKAGLNPNLVYGTGTVTGNTSGQIPKYQQEGVEQPNIPKEVAAGLGGQLQGALQIAQIKSIQSTTEAQTLANTTTRQQMGLEPVKDGLNLNVTKLYNEVLEQADTIELKRLNINAQQFRNKILSLQADLASEGIITGQTGMQSLIAVAINLLKKSGFNLSDLTSTLIKQLLK